MEATKYTTDATTELNKGWGKVGGDQITTRCNEPGGEVLHLHALVALGQALAPQHQPVLPAHALGSNGGELVVLNDGPDEREHDFVVAFGDVFGAHVEQFDSFCLHVVERLLEVLLLLHQHLRLLVVLSHRVMAENLEQVDQQKSVLNVCGIV